MKKSFSCNLQQFSGDVCNSKGMASTEMNKGSEAKLTMPLSWAW